MTYRIVYEHGENPNTSTKYIRNEYGLFCSNGRYLCKWSDQNGWIKITTFIDYTPIEQVESITRKMFGWDNE